MTKLDFEKLDPKLRKLGNQLRVLAGVDRQLSECAMLEYLLQSSDRVDKADVLTQVDELEKLLLRRKREPLIQKGVEFYEADEIVKEQYNDIVHLGINYITRYFEDIEVYMKSYVKKMVHEFAAILRPKMEKLKKAFIRDYRTFQLKNIRSGHFLDF